MVDSLHWTAETCTTLKSNYTPILKKVYHNVQLFRHSLSFDLQSPLVRDSVGHTLTHSVSPLSILSSLHLAVLGTVLNNILNRYLHFISLMWRFSEREGILLWLRHFIGIF